jgi:hypothetical protein
MAPFGGLEEFVVNLAIGLKRKGQDVSVLSTVWGSPDNQYLRGLRENDVTVVQLSKWHLPISRPAKKRILSIVTIATRLFTC